MSRIVLALSAGFSTAIKIPALSADYLSGSALLCVNSCLVRLA